MESKDVTDLHDATSRHRGCGDGPAVANRHGQWLLDEAVTSGGQARLGDRPMAVGRRHDVHRIDPGQRGAEVVAHASWIDPLAHRPLPPRRRHLGHPHGGAELRENSQMLLAPATETDEQDVHRV